MKQYLKGLNILMRMEMNVDMQGNYKNYWSILNGVNLKV